MDKEANCRWNALDSLDHPSAVAQHPRLQKAENEECKSRDFLGPCCLVLESDYLWAGNQFGGEMKGTAQGKNKAVLKENALKKCFHVTWQDKVLCLSLRAMETR